MPLKDVFEDFKKSKDTIQKIHRDTIEYFNQLVEKLSGPRDAELKVELTQVASPPNSPGAGSGDVAEATALISDVHFCSSPTVALGDIQCDFDNALAELLYTTKERKEVESLFTEEPSLIFVGQTNCGKSSIINELLGCKSLPTSEQPSTARIVRVHYAKEPFCRLTTKDGKILEVWFIFINTPQYSKHLTS